MSWKVLVCCAVLPDCASPIPNPHPHSRPLSLSDFGWPSARSFEICLIAHPSAHTLVRWPTRWLVVRSSARAPFVRSCCSVRSSAPSPLNTHNFLRSLSSSTNTFQPHPCATLPSPPSASTCSAQGKSSLRLSRATQPTSSALVSPSLARHSSSPLPSYTPSPSTPPYHAFLDAISI